MLKPLSLLLIFLSGLFTTLSPCLFPILPMFVAYMAKAKGRMQGLLGGLACTLGIMSSFAFYAITASFIGTFFIATIPSLVPCLGFSLLY